MARRKLTLSVDTEVIERARIYSQTHRTTISRLVTRFLSELPVKQESALSPTVQKLMGIMPATVDVADYRRHLEGKHSL